MISDVEVAATGLEPTTLNQQISQNGQMVKWLNFAKWLSVLYELQMFMDWNPVAMTTRGMKNELTRLVDSV